MFNFCKHKYGKVGLDGFQYCEKCGYAKHVHIPCNHRWKTISNSNITRTLVRGISTDSDPIIGEIFILECQKCGDVIQKKFNCQVS